MFMSHSLRMSLAPYPEGAWFLVKGQGQGRERQVKATRTELGASRNDGDSKVKPSSHGRFLRAG